MIEDGLICQIHQERLQHKIEQKQGAWKLVCNQCSELIRSGILNCETAEEIQLSFQDMLNLKNDNNQKLQNLKNELIPLKQKIEKLTQLIDQQNQLYDENIQKIRNNFQRYGQMSLQQQMKQMNTVIMQTKGLLQQSLASICQSSQLQKMSQDIENLRLFKESYINNNNQQNQFIQQQKLQQPSELQKVEQQSQNHQNQLIISKVEQESKQKFEQEQQNIEQQQNNQQIQDIQQQQINQQIQVIEQQQQIQKTKKYEPQKDQEQQDFEQQDAIKTKKIDIKKNSLDNDPQNGINQTQKIQPKQDINKTQKIDLKNKNQPQNYNEQQKDSQDFEEQQIQGNQDSDIQIQEESKSPSQDKVLQIKTLAKIQQQQNCWALAFNNNSQKLAVGFDQNIKIFQVLDGVQLKEEQILIGHTSTVSCIQFLNGNDTIISASYDYSIKIWEYDQKLGYNNIQTLCAHSGFIQSLQISQRDHLIISGSQDGSIKFWKFDEIWNCSQTLDTITNNVYCLSLNDSEYKLIASVNGSKPEILVIEQSSDSKWYLFQRIHLENVGFRLCFIDNNTFTFQPNDYKNILTFSYNENFSEFVQKEQSYQSNASFDSGGLFPQQFNQTKQLLITKQVGQILILRKQGQNFQVEQSIQFPNEHGLYGALNKDGNLLALWSLSEQKLYLRGLEN